MKFTAAAVQIAPAKGNVEANSHRIAEAILRCSEEGADLVVFPETAFSGYFLQGGVAEAAMSSDKALNLLQLGTKDLTRPVDAIVGFYEQDGGTVYNSAIHARLEGARAHKLHVHRKFFLPTYGVFDEERYVTRGRNLSTYETRFGPMSMLICEDLWHSVAPTIVALKGARLIAALTASPIRGFEGDTFANVSYYHRLLRGISQEHGVWCVNAMLVGFEGGKGFCGGSVITDPFGAVAAEGPTLEEHILLADIDSGEVDRARAASPLLADLQSVLEDVTREMMEVNEQLSD